MNSLAQFFTQKLIANLLISRLEDNNPKKIIDLGVGDGSLLISAYERWNTANLIGVDVDDKHFTNISTCIPHVDLKLFDSLSKQFSKQLHEYFGTIDIAICNPPYLRIQKNEYIKDILLQSNLKNSINLKYYTSDIIFFAQNLLMLKNMGELAIILPDTVISGHDFKLFRIDLIKNHRIIGIIQLPEKVFKQTEAKTSIIFLRKNGTTKTSVPLYLANRKGELFETINVGKHSLIKRMDFAYHKWAQKKQFNYFKKISDFDIEIKRGNHTKLDLEKTNNPFFHTSSFKFGNNSPIKLPNAPLINGINASQGDILLARVGKRNIGKITHVISGTIPISDCVYRIRASESIQNLLWDRLTSKEGQEWIKQHSHGVCASVISKKDLLTFPIVKY